MNDFDKKTGGPIAAADISILQVNVGLQCNQACAHCHLECSPTRTESMSWETMERIIALAAELQPSLVDITGGAPELNRNLRRFVLALKEGGHAVQVRTNLTVMDEPGLYDSPEFFAENKIGLVASMPCYLEENVRALRGDFCFTKSIAILRRLNDLGYGQEGGPTLDLVYNPAMGVNLPPGQAGLEQDYKREMEQRYGVIFNHLFTLANVPIGRFLDELKAKEQDGPYMDLLAGSFNPATVDGLMCRHQVNVGWDGRLYDCDFNQALGLPVNHGAPDRIEDFDREKSEHRRIVTGRHCFACTAGTGSSCGGALTE